MCLRVPRGSGSQNASLPGEGFDMKSKFITSGIPSAISCSITPAKLHLQHEGTGLNTSTPIRGSDLCTRAVFEEAPLDFRHSHRDEAVKLLLRVEAIARARVLPAGSAGSLPRLGFRNPLDCQDLQSTAWKTPHVSKQLCSWLLNLQSIF